MSDPVSVLDAAKYILTKQGYMSSMKLQKLVYYAQAWALVWDGEPLFAEETRAWRDGPVVRELFDAHKGRFEIDASDIQGDVSRLSEEQRATIDAVLADYGRYDGLTLSNQTHLERPWKEARKGFEPSAISDVPITNQDIQNYYASL